MKHHDELLSKLLEICPNGELNEDLDGYLVFYTAIPSGDPDAELNAMTRAQIVTELEEVYSVACYDEESTEELREALKINRADGIS